MFQIIYAKHSKDLTSACSVAAELADVANWS